MGKWLVFTTVISLIASVSPAWAGGDVASGKEQSAACAGCHGADGNSVNPDWPKLAGQGENYLDKQLQDFKSGARKNATMVPMVAALNKQDMANLAAFFASQTRQIGSTDEKFVELGQKIYRGGNSASGVPACSGCHSPNGAGNPAASFPALSGQHAKYVETQLNAFKSGERSNDAGKMMRTIAGKMSEKEIRAVASYVQGLH